MENKKVMELRCPVVIQEETKDGFIVELIGQNVMTELIVNKECVHPIDCGVDEDPVGAEFQEAVRLREMRNNTIRFQLELQGNNKFGISEDVIITESELEKEKNSLAKLACDMLKKAIEIDEKK